MHCDAMQCCNQGPKAQMYKDKYKDVSFKD